MPPLSSLTASYRRIAERVARLVVDTLHNGLALVGIVVLAVGVLFFAQPQWRQFGEFKLFGWLQERQIEMGGMVTDLLASERATAVNPKDLPKQQVMVATWLSKRYKVALEPLSAIVAEAYDASQRSQLDPKLVLAVMAIESGFNPFAQSAVGAQGLMQVMTRVHSDKYLFFGGKFAAFDPLANVRVGVKVLHDCIRDAGSIEGGLQRYVGATNKQDDGGYTAKVMSEYDRLQRVADGKAVSIYDTSNPVSSVKAITPSPEQAGSPSRLALN